MEKIIILGNGGHAKSLVDAIERQNRFEIMGHVINKDFENGIESDYPVIGTDEDLAKLFQQGTGNAAIGIGFMGKGKVRKRLFYQLKQIGFSLPVICDPSAVLSGHTTIEEGTFIGKGAIINSASTVGKMCIINTGAIIEHDCLVGDFSHVSVGTVLCGDVKIGRESFIGANATIIQGRRVGDGCIVSAGAIVREDIEDGVIYR